MTYSQSLALSQRRYSTNGRNSVSYKKRGKSLGPISNTVVLIVLGCLLGLLYLTQVTKTNAYGYDIADLKAEQSSLTMERSNLELTSARLQSIERVQDSSVAKTMVPVSPSATVEQ